MIISVAGAWPLTSCQLSGIWRTRQPEVVEFWTGGREASCSRSPSTWQLSPAVCGRRRQQLTDCHRRTSWKRDRRVWVTNLSYRVDIWSSYLSSQAAVLGHWRTSCCRYLSRGYIIRGRSAWMSVCYWSSTCRFVFPLQSFAYKSTSPSLLRDADFPICLSLYKTFFFLVNILNTFKWFHTSLFYALRSNGSGSHWRNSFIGPYQESTNESIDETGFVCFDDI